jgi:ABC-2 type transport system permease protein
MKGYFTTIGILAKTFIHRTFRDKTALFFTFLFPLIFLVVFGELNKGNSFNFELGLINQASTPFATHLVSELEQSKDFKVTSNISFNDAKTKLGQGQLDGIVVLPQGFGAPDAQGIPHGTLVTYYDQSSEQTGQTLAQIMQSILDQVNDKYVLTQKPLQVTTRATQTANLTQFDYTFAGLLGFSILSLGIFGMANGFAGDKKNGALRRLRVSPLRSSQLIIATALNYVVLGLIALTLMFLVAVKMFNFEMHGNYIIFVLYAILSILMMFGFGLAIAGWAKNENQAAPLANLIAFPMMFLSGVFFPRYLMPEWLGNLTGYLPLSPVVDGLRYISTEGKTFLQLGPQLAIIGVWTVIIYAVAFLVFRWE